MVNQITSVMETLGVYIFCCDESNAEVMEVTWTFESTCRRDINEQMHFCLLNKPIQPAINIVILIVEKLITKVIAKVIFCVIKIDFLVKSLFKMNFFLTVTLSAY